MSETFFHFLLLSFTILAVFFFLRSVKKRLDRSIQEEDSSADPDDLPYNHM